MSIKRFQMPNTYSGRKVPDKFMCDVGHLHPSWKHASKCCDRRRKAESAKMAKREWHGCSDPRGHSFVEGICQTPGCGMNLAKAGGLIVAAKTAGCAGVGEHFTIGRDRG